MLGKAYEVLAPTGLFKAMESAFATQGASLNSAWRRSPAESCMSRCAVFLTECVPMRPRRGGTRTCSTRGGHSGKGARAGCPAPTAYLGCRDRGQEGAVPAYHGGLPPLVSCDLIIWASSYGYVPLI